MPKEKLLDIRPEPPTLDQILEDLGNANENDVAFNFLTSQDSNVDCGSGGNKESKDQQKKPTNDNSEAEELYSKVESFLEMNKYLIESQERLKEQCSELETLGEKVQKQIEALKGHMT